MRGSHPIESLGRYVHFTAIVLPRALRSLARPRELLRQLYQTFVGAMPLAAVTGLALGVVIWMHLHSVLVRSGPGYSRLLPEYLALAVVLEFAPLSAGLIVAGRSGASLGAELSSMRLTEQLDALDALGQSPMHYLVAPRVLACMIALPLLTALIAILAVAGSYAAELAGGTMAWQEYYNACLRDLRVKDLVAAVLKTVVFGFLIGTVGCYSGMTAAPATEAVGRAATGGVVFSILLVVLSDVVLVRIIQLLD
jgi:phospholipid/cholesterol/gamma-HCH transport system permease protein